jgi:hypothetical protein
MLGMPSPGRFRLARCFEPLRRILPDRLEHPEPLAAVPHQALFDERLQQVDVCVADGFRRLERAAREDREPREQQLFLAL